MVKERVLVTGGTGFIGSNLCLTLEAKGYEVIAADYQIHHAAYALRGFKGKVVSMDVTHPLRVDEPLTAVFHQAALTDPRHPDDKEIFQKNVTGFQNVIALVERKNAKLIYASTAGLYGNGPTPMKEDQAKQIQTSYGKSKLKMDDMAAALATKMHVVGLRYFNVFGPREAYKGKTASMIFHLHNQMKEGKRPRLFKMGEQKRDHIYVDDVVRANLAALNTPSGVYNVGTGTATSFNDLVKMLNKVMGTSLEAEYFDMPYTASTYQSNTQADTKLAETKLGFRAKVSLEEGITQYLAWLKDNPQI